jgi:predicted dehydrogenase
VGAIGLGLRGGLGALADKPGRGSRVLALCDVDRGAVERARGWYGGGPKAFTDYRELLARDVVDAVIVSTPDHTHEEIAVAALEAGKATYVEKPLAITIEGCDRILATAARTGTRLYVGHNMRHMAFVQLMRDRIRDGVIGDVKALWCRHFVGYGKDFYFRDWHADRRNTTGLLLQKGAHDIDVIHWLAGSSTRRVTAMGAQAVFQQGQPDLYPVVDVEDVSMVLLELGNGVLASYQQCHFTPDYWRNYTVIGTDGRMENFGDTGADAVIRLWNRQTDHKDAGDATWPVPERMGRHGGADESIVGEFIRFARDGGPTLTSPVAARDAVAAGVMATRSLREGGRPFDVPPLDSALAARFVTSGEDR